MSEEKEKVPDYSVFTRQSTGLVKNVSFLGAIALNFSNMSAGPALATISFTTIAFFFLSSATITGMNLVYGSIIAFVFSIPQIVVYTMMTRRLPRSGGDYVWVSRTYGGFFGSSIAFMGYTLETLAFLALIAFAVVEAIGSVAVANGYSGWLSLAVPPSSGGSPGLQFVIGAVIFAILILVNIFTPKNGYRLVTILAVLGAIGLVVAIFSLLVGGHAGAVRYASGAVSALGSNNYSYGAIASSYSGTTFNFGNTLLLLPFFAIFVYPWLNAAPAVASEVKSKNALRWNVPIASVISLILVTGGFAAMYYAGGFDYVTGALTNSGMVFNYTFNFWTFAMGVTGSAALAWIIGIGWILLELAILAYGIIVFSRYLFAQSFDRFLPSRISYVSPKYGSPAVAHVIDLVITVSLIGVIAYLYGSLQALFAAVIAAMIYFLFVGISAAIHGAKKEKGQARGTLIVAGILMAIVFAFIIYQFFSYPTIWGTGVTAFGIPGTYFAYIYVVASFVAGALIFLYSKHYHRQKGIDITLAYKEIPPE